MHIAHDPGSPPADRITFDDFLKVDLRVGTVVAAQDYPEARAPSLIVHVDFGPAIGVLKSSARIAENYTADELVGRQIAAVVNFAPRQIGSVLSRALIVGFPDERGNIVLFSPDVPLPNGSRLS